MRRSKIAYHELYTVYEDGRIHSGKSDVFLIPRINPNGYLIVQLDGKQMSVHRLVASHFIPNPYNYSQVNHLDGNKTNNHTTNLEWCSADQNIQHALKTGLKKGYIHVDIKRRMMCRAIRGELIADLALEVGNHPNVLSRMLREQSKKDGRYEEWKKAMKVRRRNTATRNLEKVNAKN